MVENEVDILCIIDRSGSMGAIKSDAIGGFNTFLERQQKDTPNARMTLIQFNHLYNEVYMDVNIKDVKPYDVFTYLPEGTTALYDAIGKAVSNLTSKLNLREDKTGKVICVILTDGEENSSREYRIDAIKKLIEEKKTAGWEFIFVTAGLDSFVANGIGVSMGVSQSNIFSVQHNARGMVNAYNAIGNAVVSYSSTGKVSKNWKTEYR